MPDTSTIPIYITHILPILGLSALMMYICLPETIDKSGCEAMYPSFRDGFKLGFPTK
jgi:hypothetical protein